jgi:signal transduction histidine kinase
MSRTKDVADQLCQLAILLAGTFVLLSPVGSAQEQIPRNSKQIVILYTHRTLTPINADWDRGIRSALAAGFSEPLDIEIEYLNLVRHKDPDYLRSWIELLRTKYVSRPPDLIIPVFVPALEFTLEHRDTLFPKIPIVFCSAPLKLAEAAHAHPGVTGVTFRLDIAGTISTAKSLHPSHDRLLILSGSSNQEQASRKSIEEAIRGMNTGLQIESISGLPRKELLSTIDAIEAGTIVLMLNYDEDTQGNHYSTVEIIDELSARSPAPVYGLYDTLLGHGIVGGSLASAESQGKLAGSLAVRVLKGERPEDIPITGLETVQLQFDARQLKRWNLSESDLPAESRVLYREPTFWEQFGHYVLPVTTAILLQSGIIVALLINRSRRFTAEREARDLAGKILTAQEDERRYLAREMHDDLSQRLAASAITAGHLEKTLSESAETRESLGKLRGSLVGICDDMHRLSRQIHPAILDDFGLAEALHAECDRLGERNGISVEYRCGELPTALSRDIAICLYRIAQEAFWNAAKYSGTERVIVELNSDAEFIYLSIRDFGRGFDPLEVAKRQGLGMSSMKERARLVRGTIVISSAPGSGVTIEVQVPLPEDAA